MFLGHRKRVKELVKLLKLWGFKKVILAFFVIFLQSILQFGAVVTISPLMDVVLNNGSYHENIVVNYLSKMRGDILSINEVLIFVLIVQFAAMLSNLFAEYVKYRLYASFSYWLKASMANAVTSRPYSYIIKQNAAVMNRWVDNDSNLYCNSVFWPVVEITSRLVVAMGLIVGCISLSPQLALIFITIGASFYLIVTSLLKGVRKRISNSGKVEGEKMAAVLLALLQGIKSVMISHSREFYLEKYQRALRIMSRYGAIGPLLSNIPRYLIEFMAIALMIGYFSVAITNGGLRDIASLAAIAFAAYRLLPIFQQIYSSYSGIQSHLYAMDSVNLHLLNQTGVQQRPNAAEDLLADGKSIQQIMTLRKKVSTKGLAYSYHEDGSELIRWPDLEIQQGAIVGICGPSGCGKSTLLDLMLGLLSPLTGQILIDGVALKKANVESWQKQIGYVGQDLFLFDGTIKENILFGRPVEGDETKAIRQAAQKAQIHQFIENLPDGYNTMSGDRGLRLSGGQRQRIVIARALLLSPKVLVLDEATSALDAEAEERIINTICELSGKMTIIMVTHRLNTLGKADRVIDLGREVAAR